MCGMCPDFVTACADEGCEKRTPGSKSTLFFLDDTFCVRLTEEYGTADANMFDHFLIYHVKEGCECVVNKWPGYESPSQKLLDLQAADETDAA